MPNEGDADELMSDPERRTQDQQISAFIARHRVLGRLDSAAQARLAAATAVTRYARGQEIGAAAERAGQARVIVSGYVAQFVQSGEARATLLTLSQNGAVLEVGAALRGEASRRACFAFSSPTLVASLPRELLVDAIRGCAPALFALLGDVAAEQDLYARRLGRISQSSAQRHAALLLELAEDFGDEMIDGATVIPLRLTRHHLATFIGATMETVARMMSAWTRDGVLASDERGIAILDLRRLELFADDERGGAAAAEEGA